MQERWLSVDEIAAHLGVNPETIYKWITRKRMPAHKLGRLWKFLATEVDQWVKDGCAANKSTSSSHSNKKPSRLREKTTKSNSVRPAKHPLTE
ncbi:MAG: helix-turn-helix domain-containing protein [Verrucomicrobia bacterium]|nr:helix-turn-helix domain-containing protein [Verrucomicrobiota bacterium]